MSASRHFRVPALLASAMLAALSLPASAQETAAAASAPPSVVSPEARAVLDRMEATLQTLDRFAVEAHSSRDEVRAFGYKMQLNEHSTLVVQRPDKLRAELSGDVRNRTFVYDGATFTMYSPDDKVYAKVDAPDSLKTFVGGLLDAGVEMPLIDLLYTGAAGNLTENVRAGLWAGESNIRGVPCDQLAFRQASVDWQLWVEKGPRALPRKIVITTRYAVGDPQYVAELDWDLKPRIDKSTFVFKVPEGASQITFANAAAIKGTAP